MISSYFTWTGTVCSNLWSFFPFPTSVFSSPMALIRTVSSSGAVIWKNYFQCRFQRRLENSMLYYSSTSAEYGIFTEGVSWHGIMERQCMGQHRENTYGWVFPAVCAGVSHCKAEAFGFVEYSMRILKLKGRTYKVGGKIAFRGVFLLQLIWLRKSHSYFWSGVSWRRVCVFKFMFTGFIYHLVQV